MTNDEAKKLLIAYNVWRRGDSDDMPNPRQLGLAIDLAISALDVDLSEDLDAGYWFGKSSKSSIAQNIRDAAINWPKYLGVVECGILDFAFNCDGDGFMHWKLRENQTMARTFMLFVAEALESSRVP